VTTWTVKLTDDAKADFKRLDGREKAIVAKKLMNLERDPRIGTEILF
jgi:mRNA-degrading endonuclease RelE of RelBE toxin-antitoxin system